MARSNFGKISALAAEAHQEPGVDQNDVPVPPKTEVEPASNIGVEAVAGEDPITTSLAVEALVNYTQDRFVDLAGEVRRDVTESEKFLRGARSSAKTALAERFVGARAPDVLRLIMMRGAAVNDIDHLTGTYGKGLAEIMKVLNQLVSANGKQERMASILPQASDLDLLCNFKLSFDKGSNRYELETYSSQSALIRIRGIWRLPFWAIYLLLLAGGGPLGVVAIGGVIATSLARALAPSGIFGRQGAITDKFDIVVDMMDVITTETKMTLTKLQMVEQKLSAGNSEANQAALSLVMVATKYLSEVMGSIVSYQSELLTTKPVRDAVSYANELAKNIDK